MALHRAAVGRRERRCAHCSASGVAVLTGRDTCQREAFPRKPRSCSPTTCRNGTQVACPKTTPVSSCPRHERQTHSACAPTCREWSRNCVGDRPAAQLRSTLVAGVRPGRRQRPQGGAAARPSSYQATGCAALTNLSVKVLDRSMFLPLMLSLNASCTARHVLGPSGGIRPVGLKIPFSESNAFA